MGKMTNQELADWFGIKIGSFKAKKKIKLEELKDYADFDEIYGVRQHDDNQKCKVLVRVAERQVNLFRSVPIHSSQKEIVTELGYSVFEYNLKVNFDFKQEILSYLSGVEVLEPQWLRRQLASALLDLYKIYRNDYVNS